MALRRRSQFRNRINKMQGLPIDEKMMLLRMGEIIDKGINQRTPTNPNPNRGHIRGEIPMPSGLQAAVSTRGAVLSWSKINGNNLLNYRIRITPIDGEGEELIVTSYTNQFLFKGHAGRYIFTVQSNSRDGKASDWAPTVEFSISDSPMILEGNKFDVETLGVQLFETVLTPLNYTVFAFASVVLNTLADPNNNPSVTLELRHGATYVNSVFIQQFDLYPESEDLCNFDSTVGITRPSGAPSRSGTFQTTQSVMFTPYQILESTGIVDQNTTFWITVTNHSSDVVGLSCAIWVASEGLSEETEAEGTVHLKSLDVPTPVADANRVLQFLEGSNQDTSTNNIWTFSLWLKPQDLSFTQSILYYSDYIPTGLVFTTIDDKRITIIWQTSPNPRLRVQVEDNTGGTIVTWIKDGESSVWPSGADNWYLLTVAFSGERAGSKFDIYINGAVLSPDFDDSTSTTIPPYTLGSNNRLLSIGGFPAPLIWSTETDIFTSSRLDARIHQAGIWNIVLSAAAISSIYNAGNGSTRDWRFSFGAYGSQADLMHYWRFGGLNNDNTTSNASWVKAGGGTPTQAEADTNIANDVSYDLGNIPNSFYDFTNGINIAPPAFIRTQGGGPGSSFGFISPDATDIVDDFPGI